MSIEIKKAKIKNRLFLSYEYVAKENNVENKIKQDSDAPIHDDLQITFDALIPHLVHICEEEVIKSVSELEIERLLPKYKVTEVTISGSDDTEGVVISGYKTLASEKTVNFNTPFQKYSDENYPFASKLYESVGLLRTEVLAYMEGKQGKRSEVGTFNFDEDDDNEGSFKLPEGMDVETSKTTDEDE
jgi:hypothetical protein